MLKPREIRFTITPICNYRCVFCHNEGERNKESGLNTNKVIEKLNSFIERGYTDITFTGGEPLLKRYHKDIIYILNNILNTSKNDNISVTIVSNASQIDEDLISQLQVFRDRLRFNISLHSFDQTTYEKITRQSRCTVDKIANTIESLRKCGFKVKINYVLLGNINNGKEQINNAVNNAKNMGVSAIKFIELLIPDEKEDVKDYFYNVDSIKDIVDNLTLISRTDRVCKYKLIGDTSNFIIETTRCVCRLGCRSCYEYRSITFDGELNLYPCFLSVESIDMIDKSVDDLDRRCIDFIKNMALKYNDNAPILNNSPHISISKETVYFELDEEIYKLFTLNAYNDYGFMRSRYIKQKYILYKPRTADEEWEKYNMVVRIRIDNYFKERASLIASKETIFRDDALNITINRTIYSKKDSPLLEANPDMLKQILSSLDYVEDFGYEIDGYYYIYQGIRCSLSQLSNDKGRLFILAIFTNNAKDINKITDIFEKGSLKAINTAFFSYIKSRLG